MPHSDITPEYTMDVLIGQVVRVEYFAHWCRDVAHLVAGRIDDEAKEVFTRGQCHALALELHRATGWELYGAYSEHQKEYGGTPGHVVVRHPDGHFVDIEGIGVEKRWAEYGKYTFAPVDVYAVLSYDQIDYTIPALGVAKAFVPAVLAQVERQKENL